MDELVQAVHKLATELQDENPTWRRGQCAFNALNRLRPELADKVRTTNADPFYRDDRVDAFWDWLVQWI